MPISALDRSLSLLADGVTDQLVSRASSVFGRVGRDVCRQHVVALLDAVRSDLVAGKREALRGVVQSMIAELFARDLTFADLRHLAQTLRKRLIEAVEPDPDSGDLLRALDGWLFDLVLVLTMGFVAGRDEIQQKQTAKHEIQRLESQLGDLQAALEEKTHLLEIIRQASTPIAPVVEGILVVPLVGTFDSIRAENLTEKLLQEVARVHAKAAILDISGVPVFDTTAAQLIIRLARAVRLLGTDVFLVGMSPETARTIVALDVDMSGLRTLGTLRDGLAQALVLQRMKIVRT
jgi:anti-anti-sigma factor